MKTWHWIVIGVAILGAGYVILRPSNVAGVIPAVKIGTGQVDAGAPPLPNVALSNPVTGKLLVFPSQMGIVGLGGAFR
jgi:hypothetical protein